MAANARLGDVIVGLKKHGIDISTSTLSRYLRRERERRMLEARADSKDAVQELAAEGKEEVAGGDFGGGAPAVV